MSGQLLLSRLSSEFPESSPRLVRFPSGSFIIELEIRGAPYVLEYVFGKNYGLSRRARGGYAWKAVQPFDSVSDLEQGVRKLVTGPS